MPDAETRSSGPGVTPAPPGGPRVLVVAPPPAPSGPDVTDDVARYRAWVLREDERRAGGRLPDGPTVGLVVVGRCPGPTRHGTFVDSVLGQDYPHWTMFRVGHRGSHKGTWRPPRRRPTLGRRLHEVPCESDAPEALAAHLGMRHALSHHVDAVMVAGGDDVLAPGSLVAMAAAIGDGADIVYGDEDSVSAGGAYDGPCLKPDWSPDLLLSTDYMGRPVMLSAALARRCGGVRPESGEAWEYDLTLRATEQAGRIDHIAGVLLHRGPAGVDGGGAAPTLCDAARRVLEETLTRRGDEGHVEAGRRPGTNVVRRHVPGDPLVSIIVPFRDGAPLLRRCVDSVLRTADGVRIELLLVDNGSTEPESPALVRRLSSVAGVRVVEDPQPFNWAAINNRAVTETAGTVLLFLNDDVAALGAGWLAAMLEHAVRPDVGAVGARLVYPTGHVQHVGVVIGLGGAAGHVLRGLPVGDPGYLAQAVVTRDVSAVTGACLMTRRSCFEEMGGFDEELSTDLNDVDYCLRLRASGYRTVVTPLAELVHEESPTRGSSGNIASIRAFLERWEATLRAGDPFLNRNLTRIDGSCRLRGDDEERRWESWRASLEAPTTA